MIYGRPTGLRMAPTMPQLGMAPTMPQLGVPLFESWGWRHRKLIVVGSGLTLGALVIAGVSALLR